MQTKSKKEAEKVIKSLIKTSVKVGMLERADKFSAAERRAIEDVRRNIVTVAMTLVSFHQVDHTYDRAFVTKYLRDIQSDLKAVVRPHLTEKSLGRCVLIMELDPLSCQTCSILFPRIDHMMDFFSQPQFLDSLHAADKTTDLSRQVAVLMALLNTCLEKGVI